MKQITATKGTINYMIELAVLKGISLGKKNTVDVDIESVVKSLSEQLTNDLERYSHAKQRF